MSEEVRSIVAEFAARDTSAAAISGFIRNIDKSALSFNRMSTQIGRITRLAGFTYLIDSLGKMSEEAAKASYAGENIGLSMLKSLPVLKQIDQATSDIAKNLADIATHGQITSNELLGKAQTDYEKLFQQMRRASELANASPEAAAKLKIEYSYLDRIDEIKEWTKSTDELTRHNEVLKKQI